VVGTRCPCETSWRACGLLAAIEERSASAKRYELFTGRLSEGYVRLYRRLGYREFHEREIYSRLRLTYPMKTGSRSRRAGRLFSADTEHAGDFYSKEIGLTKAGADVVEGY
jgi:hypothetical protein